MGCGAVILYVGSRELLGIDVRLSPRTFQRGYALDLKFLATQPQPTAIQDASRDFWNLTDPRSYSVDADLEPLISYYSYRILSLCELAHQ